MARSVCAVNRGTVDLSDVGGNVSSSAPAERYRCTMNTTDAALAVPVSDRPDPTRIVPGFGHLLLRDMRTPEEQWAAMIKEADRRKGRGRSRWWEERA